MKTRSKMILGLASLLGVTAGATAVSGFAWFVTTKTAIVDVTNIGVYNNNPSLSVTLNNLKGVTKVNDASNDFDLRASRDTTYFSKKVNGDGTTKEWTLDPAPAGTPKAYVDGVKTNIEYNASTHVCKFATAPDAGKEILFEYCEAALTDISSTDGIHFYDPTWMAAYEGRKATKLESATAGQQYISFDMVFAGLETGSLNVLLDRPKIEPKATDTNAADTEAAAVARVAFVVNNANVLTLSKNKIANYDKGISEDKATEYPGDSTLIGGAATDPDYHKDATDVSGNYVVKEFLDNCENLENPSTTDYSVLSSTPGTDSSDMFICNVGADPVTVSVRIWLEGTSHVDSVTGNNSTPIGGEISVKLPIIAFNA